MDTATETICSLLQDEQQRGSVHGLVDLQARQLRRAMISQHLKWAESQLRHLREQIKDLPALPPLSTIRWAQSMQAMPNLVYLEVDTTGLYNEAEIIRILVLDNAGKTLLDNLVQPSHPISTQIAHVTGVTNQDLEAAGQPIDAALACLRSTLLGAYVLSFNLKFDQGKLNEATTRCGQEAIPLIGECLMERAMHYRNTTDYLKLETLCSQIGHSLPAQPGQTALDRAHGQRALLDAMAHAITGVPDQAPINTDEDLDDLDEHPF